MMVMPMTTTMRMRMVLIPHPVHLLVEPWHKVNVGSEAMFFSHLYALNSSVKRIWGFMTKIAEVRRTSGFHEKNRGAKSQGKSSCNVLLALMMTMVAHKRVVTKMNN